MRVMFAWVFISLAGTCLFSSSAAAATDAKANVTIGKTGAIVDNTSAVIKNASETLNPIITVLPSSVSFECDVDEPNVLTETLLISNSGDGTLPWQVIEDCQWLSVEPIAGQCTSEPNEVTISVDTEGMKIGFYSYELTITGDNASKSPQTVPVSLHVYRSGERHVPIEYPTIGDAVYTAMDGDHIIIQPGFYCGEGNSSIHFRDKELVIRSIDPNDLEIVGSTVISGEDIYGSTCFFIYSNTNQGNTIAGLTIRDFVGPAIYCSRGYIRIADCVFTDNETSGQPGQGVYLGTIMCGQGAMDIERCQFYENHPTYSPSQIGLISIGSGTASINNCLISTSITEGIDSRAGLSGIALYNSDVEINNCTIGFNGIFPNSFAHTTGGGIFIRQSNVNISNSIVWGNIADYGANIAIINYYPTNDIRGISRVNITYSNIQGGQEQIGIFPAGDGQQYPAFYLYYNEGVLPDPNLADPNTLTWGEGNIDVDPLFAREPNDGGDGWSWSYEGQRTVRSNNDRGDLHLKSPFGRFVWEGYFKADFNMDKQVNTADIACLGRNWGRDTYNEDGNPRFNLFQDRFIDVGDLQIFCEQWLCEPVFGKWTADTETSPCIDAGDPGDADWQNEPTPNGGRINMGAYGGTSQASMSANSADYTANLNNNEEDSGE